MKKVLLIGGAVLVLAGGAGGWWFFLRQASTAQEQVGEAPPSFMPLAPMTISVVNDGRVIGQVTLEVSLALQSADRQEAVTQALPRLTDAILVELHSLLGRRLMVDRGYDLGLIKLRLKGVAARIVGDDVVTDILVKNMGQHRHG